MFFANFVLVTSKAAKFFKYFKIMSFDFIFAIKSSIRSYISAKYQYILAGHDLLKKQLNKCK